MSASRAVAGRPRRRSDRPAILLVEDDEALRSLLAEQLKEAGFAVALAGDHRDALAIIESGDRLDLLIADLVIPSGIGGLTLGRLARLRRPRLKLLYFTGYDIPAGPRDPGGPILRKPLAPDNLLSAIDGLLH